MSDKSPSAEHFSIDNTRSSFETMAKLLFSQLSKEEDLNLNLLGESSYFLRFSKGKTRQNGWVDDASVQARLVTNSRSVSFNFPLSNCTDVNKEVAINQLSVARNLAKTWPEDPFLVPIESHPSSEETHRGELPDPTNLPAIITDLAGNLDLVGYYSGGLVMRGAMNSKGMKHWFSVENFVLDYSAALPSGQAVKGCYAGRSWNEASLCQQIQHTREQVETLKRPRRALKPGKYRVYLAPTALVDLMSFVFSAVGEASLRQGESPFVALREGRHQLSPLFSLADDFRLGLVPRFNSDGEIAPETLPIFEKGALVNTLVSARSAREYDLASNAAPPFESLRSPNMATGSMPNSDILRQLGTGLYLSNLNYTNYSDMPNGRITGMTRYACFWVENGKMVEPITDMRFDDSIYSFLGNNLEEVTAESELVPEKFTYDQRSLGGARLPGILVKDFSVTL